MKNKIFLLMFCMIFLIGSISALDFEDCDTGFTLDNIKIYDENYGDYGKITIRNFIGIFKLAEYTLIDYESSVINVWAEGTAKLYKDHHLFSGIDFKNLAGNLETLRDVKILIWINESYKIDVNDYEKQCDEVMNGTNATEVCHRIIIGSHQETKFKTYWKEYTGEKLNEGDYSWRLEGKRNLNQPIDFILKAHGKKFNEWEWLNESWEKKRELSNLTGDIVYLNITFDSDMKADFGDIRFTNTAGDTEYAYFLEKKVNSAWAVFRVRTFGATEIDMYYNNSEISTTSSISDVYGSDLSGAWFMDERSGNNVPDYSNFDDNGTRVAMEDADWKSAKIDYGLDFEESEYFNVSDNSRLDMTTAITLSAWIKLDIIDDYQDIIQKGVSSGTGTNYHLSLDNSNYILFNFYDEDTTAWKNCLDDTSLLTTGTWYHVAAKYDQTNMSIYLDGVSIKNCSETAEMDPNNKILGVGYDTDASNYGLDGFIDEAMIYKRVLNSTEIGWLNNTTEPVYVLGSEELFNLLAVNLESPIDYYNSISPSINFKCNATDETGIYNLTLILNGVDNHTETGAGNTNLSIDILRILEDGDYNWTCRADDGTGSGRGSPLTASERYFNINTTPFIQFEDPTPIDNYNSTNSYIPVNVSLTETYFDNLTFNFYNGTLTSYFYEDNTRFINESFADGNYTYNVTIWTTTGQSNNTGNRNISMDTTLPQINITSPTDSDYFILGNNETLNWTITDEHLDSCWYNYNGTNQSLNCTANTTSFILEEGNYNLTFYANDTFGNVNSSFIEWVYTIFETSRSFTAEVLQSSLHGFELNITTDGLFTPIAYLVYNGTEYLSSSSNVGNDYAFLNNIPTNVAGNIDFYWYINYDVTLITLFTSYQNVTSLSLEMLNISTSCGSLDAAMYWNFKNAINRSLLENATINYNFRFGISDDSIGLIDGTLSIINEFYLCINSTIYNDYSIGYGEIQYEKEGYSDRRWYVFENTRVSNTTINNSLYLLPSGSSTSFLIEVRDNALTPYQNNYISLLRWYPEIDEYKIVEMGKTDDKGQTITKVEVEDVDYRIGVYKQDGELIHLANPIRMACLISPCTYVLTIQDEASRDFKVLLGVDHSLIFTGGAFKFIYNDPSQTTSLMQLDVYKITGTTETLICTTNATASTGVLTCNVSTSTGQLKAKAFRTASPTQIIATLWHNTIETPFQSTFGLFITFLITLTLFLMGIAMPVAAIILGILAMIMGLILGSISYPIIIALGVIAGIVIHFMRKT